MLHPLNPAHGSHAPHDRRQRIAVVSFEPFALWWQRATHPTGHPDPACATTLDGERILQVDTVARAAGVTPGMTLAGAQQRLPGLRIVPAVGPELDAAWDAHLDGMLDLSPRIEALRLGLAALQADLHDAARLAEDHGARVGFADAVETAWLLAYLAEPGCVHAAVEKDPWIPLDAAPLELLGDVGLPSLEIERLAWLGVTTIGTLRRWKPAQLDAYLGPAAAPVRRLLYGPYQQRVALRPPPLVAAAEHAFDDAVSEPSELDPVLAHLVRRAVEGLHGRSAERVRVVAHGVGVRSEGTRRAKQPLRDPIRLLRLAHLALEDGALAPLGIELLRVELSGLSRPSEAGELWPQRRRRLQASSAVHARFPGQARQFEAHDPAALRARLRWRLRNLASGDEITPSDGHAPTDGTIPSSRTGTAPSEIPTAARTETTVK